MRLNKLTIQEIIVMSRQAVSRYSDSGVAKKGVEDGAQIPPIPKWEAKELSPFLQSLVSAGEKTIYEIDNQWLNKDSELGQEWVEKCIQLENCSTEAKEKTNLYLKLKEKFEEEKEKRKVEYEEKNEKEEEEEIGGEKEEDEEEDEEVRKESEEEEKKEFKRWKKRSHMAIVKKRDVSKLSIMQLLSISAFALLTLYLLVYLDFDYEKVDLRSLGISISFSLALLVFASVTGELLQREASFYQSSFIISFILVLIIVVAMLTGFTRDIIGVNILLYVTTTAYFWNKQTAVSSFQRTSTTNRNGRINSNDKNKITKVDKNQDDIEGDSKSTSRKSEEGESNNKNTTKKNKKDKADNKGKTKSGHETNSLSTELNIAKLDMENSVNRFERIKADIMKIQVEREALKSIYSNKVEIQKAEVKRLVKLYLTYNYQSRKDRLEDFNLEYPAFFQTEFLENIGEHLKVLQDLDWFDKNLQLKVKRYFEEEEENETKIA